MFWRHAIQIISQWLSCQIVFCFYGAIVLATAVGKFFGVGLQIWNWVPECHPPQWIWSGSARVRFARKVLHMMVYVVLPVLLLSQFMWSFPVSTWVWSRFLSGTFIHDKVRRGDYWQDDFTALDEDEDEGNDWWPDNHFDPINFAQFYWIIVVSATHHRHYVP